jgi:allantoinase
MVHEGQVDWIVSDPRLLRGGSEAGGAGGPRRHLAREVRLRRHRVPAVRRVQRGPQARLGAPPYGRAPRLQPAQRYGLLHKGDIEVGFDADLAILDPDRRFTVRAAESPSAQGYTPFEGQELTAR